MAGTERLAERRGLFRISRQALERRGIGAPTKIERDHLLLARINTVATIAIAAAGIWVSTSFNTWQQNEAAKNEASQNQRFGVVDDQALKERCLHLVSVGALLARGKKVGDAESALSSLALMEPKCPAVGVDVAKFTAAMIVSQPTRYDASLITPAAAIVNSGRLDVSSQQTRQSARSILQREQQLQQRYKLIYGVDIAGFQSPVKRTVSSKEKDGLMATDTASQSAWLDAARVDNSSEHSVGE